MQGFRFYEELNNKNRKDETSQGNVIAVYIPEMWSPDGSMVVLSAVFFIPNSDVSNGSVSREYLDTKTRRVSEAKARVIHPKLFVYLDG